MQMLIEALATLTSVVLDAYVSTCCFSHNYRQHVLGSSQYNIS